MRCYMLTSLKSKSFYMIKTQLTFRVNRYYIISMDPALCNYIIFYSALHSFGLVLSEVCWVPI